MAGSMDGKNAVVATLKKNDEEIAGFLNGANCKNWPMETLLSFLKAQEGHYIFQIDAVTAKDYGAGTTTWDAKKKHIYTIASLLAGGMEEQFPKKF
jgi:hypothetical protein